MTTSDSPEVDFDARESRLRRKLAKTEAKGNSGKVEKLKSKLEDLEQSKTIAKARRKLERAVKKGKDKKTIEKRRKKLEGLGVSAASAGASAAPDDDELMEEHETTEVKAKDNATDKVKGKGKRERDSAEETPKGTDDTEPDRSDMVLGTNGKWYPKPKPQVGNTTLLLFYAYVQPPWTRPQRMAAVEFTHKVLEENGCGGRLRVALEGFNATLTGPPDGIRTFCQALRDYDPAQFSQVDFKIQDGLPDNKAFRGLKVFPVDALVNYGIKDHATDAPLALGGNHVKPDVWTQLAAQPDTVMIDVRNANETAIGRFAPPEGGATLIDPRMRRSTEFPQWIDDHADELRGKKVLMYCTAGIRCERASALLANKGLASEIFQLDGGIHRYLDAYPKDGGIWAGKNYTFDKRFSHGAEKAEVVGKCSACKQPWERYQAQAKCNVCRMECLLCRDCERAGKVKGARLPRLLCWLCEEQAGNARAEKEARAFAASGGGRDGEGEGKNAAWDDEEQGRHGKGGFNKKQRTQ
jgi:predicted sulfurtransferase